MAEEKPSETSVETTPVEGKDLDKGKKKGRFFGDPVVEFD